MADVASAPERGDPERRFREEFTYLDVSGLENGRVSARRLAASAAPSRARQYLQANDVIISGVRVYLKNFALIGENGPDVASTAFCVLRPKPQLEPRFLYHWIQSDLFLQRLLPLQRGNSPPAVLDSDIREQPIPVPPPSAQRRIVKRINELFAEIDEGESALADARAALKTYRMSLLCAAANGVLIEKWRQPGRPKNFDRIVSGGWYELPVGWRWVSMREAGEVQLGRQRSPKDHLGPHMRPYLRVANVHEERIDTEDVKQMNFTPKEFETFQLREGDILLNEGQSSELVGRPAIFREEIANCCFQNTLVRFRPAAQVLSEFALIFFLYALHSGRFMQIAKITTNIAHLGAGRFAELPFPLPPIDEQREIVRLYREQANRISALDLENGSVADLRQSILASAFRGELAA